MAEIIERMRPAPRGLWRQLVRQDSHACASQTPEWCDAVCRLTGYTERTTIYRLSNGKQFVVPAVRRGAGPLKLHVNYSLARGWGYGGIVGPDLSDDDIATIAADLDRSAFATTAIRPNPLLVYRWDSAVRRIQGMAVRRFPHLDHVLDLSGGFDRVWNNCFKPDARTRIRKAERTADLTIANGVSAELIADFHALHLKTVSRWRRNGEDARAQTRQKFESIASALGDSVHLWVASIAKDPCAAIVVLDDGPSFSYLAGAVDETLTANRGISYLLHSLAIQRACDAGAAAYHMGETDQKSGLAQFKTRFGAQPYASAEYVLERLPIRIAAEKSRALRSSVKRRLALSWGVPHPAEPAG
jgi:hypothetical protein